MQTQVLALNPDDPDEDILRKAAMILNQGGLVGIPTETVYGLAANIFNESAVAKIYTVKGRPGNNPLIVHVHSVKQAKSLVLNWNESSQKLAEAFWPGPFTMVLDKKNLVPDCVTAGASSVALRIPKLFVTRKLIEAAGVPLAAPSANLSSAISPTTASHVLKDLEGRIEMILDAGPASGGIESTVLDVRSNPPTLLRPGLITVEMIEKIIGPIKQFEQQHLHGGAFPSPGMLARHYAPETPVIAVQDSGVEMLEKLKKEGLKVRLLGFQIMEGAVCLPNDPVGYATALYAALHDLDEMGLDRIVIALPPDTPEWLAIRDRLSRAAFMH
ncbi:MAG: threonylcarbamoyl-AMP synthase [Planctomycetes bacterium]|nr:threonylcarbamoyl-AMP synthase [Planctomycetota bacterium]NBY03249.1 threonylcarbamoyl-AMP synthase [Planctomycetota bacterium]